MNRKELMEDIVATATVGLWQDQPYTAARLCVTHESKEYTAFGFAKVSHPDEWDAKYGKDLAVRKAAAKIAKAILAEKGKAHEG